MDIFLRNENEVQNYLEPSLRSFLDRVSQEGLNPKLYHLHFTIKEADVEQIVLEGETLKIHHIFLPPDTWQHQTVFKTCSLPKLIQVAKSLMSIATCTILGQKVEILFKKGDLAAKMGALPFFNYIELHEASKGPGFFGSREEKRGVGASDKSHLSLLSYSARKQCVVSAERFYAHESAISALSVLPDSSLVEVSIFDAWHPTNIEDSWVEFCQKHTHKHIEEYLQRRMC